MNDYPPDSLRALLARRSRELDKSLAQIANEAGMARTYLYALASGSSRDPSVRILIRLSKAIRVSPLLLFRYFADLYGEIGLGGPSSPANKAIGLRNTSDIAAFNADVTMPDHAVVAPGEIFRKIWEIQNIGAIPWRGRKMVRVDGEYVVALRRPEGTLQALLDIHLGSLYREVGVSDTLPGQPVHISIDFAAPRETCTVASIWRMVDSEGIPCYGPSFFFHVVVTVMAQ